MEIEVIKTSREEDLVWACDMTVNKDVKDVNKKRLYASEHSPIRTQMFRVTCRDIPLFVSTHLLRHHVGSTPYALTKRTDRDGGEDLGRMTPTDLGMFLNAQSLIDMAKVRLCKKASPETQAVFDAIRDAVPDEDLKAFMVPKCVYRGGICSEFGCCGYNRTEEFRIELKKYLENFKYIIDLED